MVEAILKLLRF